MTRQETTAAINATVPTLTLGTELETTGLSTAEAGAVLARFFGTERQYEGGHYKKYTVTDQHGRKWTAMTDASLSGGYDHAAEIVTPPMQGTPEEIELIGQVAQALRRGGAKVDGTCGQHIHVGTYDANGIERINTKSIINLCKLWAGKETLILQAFNVSRNRMQWCAPMEANLIERLPHITSEADLNRAWFGGRANWSPDHYEGHRYHALNLNNRWRSGKTIEFRIFNGTLNPEKIAARAQFALHIAAAAIVKANTRISRPNMNGNQSPCYKMRCFLLDIGMIGEEYREARHEILRHLEGDTAWRTEEQRREHARRRRTADSRDDMEAEAADQRRAERQNEREAAQHEAGPQWSNREAAAVWNSNDPSDTRATAQVARAARAVIAIQDVYLHAAAMDLAQDICTMFTADTYDTPHAMRRLNEFRERANEIMNAQPHPIVYAVMHNLGNALYDLIRLFNA